MKVSAIEMCSSSNLDENLATARQLIAKASKDGALLAALPEMFPIFGNKESDKLQIQETYLSGKIQDFLSNVSKEFNIWIVAGTIPIKSSNPNKIRAASIVFNNQGEIVARYDKIHMFDVTISPTEKYHESNTTEPGTEIVVVDTPIGKLGLCVCFDLRFPDLFLALRKKGAEVICVPAAFTTKTGSAHWELLTRSRAIDTLCYVVASAQGGIHSNGRETYGKSMIIDPWGSVLAIKSEAGDGVISADIDLDHLRGVRKILPIN